MSEAERLADDLDAEFVTGRISNHTGRKAAAELRRLSKIETEVEALRKACNDRVRAALEEAADIAGEFDTGIADGIRRFIHVEAARPGGGK